MGELPIGFAMSLAMNEKALSYFGTLSDEAKENLVKYIQSSTTGNDAQHRIRDVILMLEKKEIM